MARKGHRKGGLLGDVLRKVPLTGVGEIRVPSDVKRVLVQNIEKVRESAVDIFAKEISKVLSRIDVHNIVEDVLRNYSLRIEARLDLVPKYGPHQAPKHGVHPKPRKDQK
jgi:hypothetical protein